MNLGRHRVLGSTLSRHVLRLNRLGLGSVPELAVIWEGGRGCLWWSKSFSIRVAFLRRIADNLLQNEDQVTVTKRCFDRIAAAVVVYNSSGKKGKSHAHYTEFTFFQQTYSVVFFQLLLLLLFSVSAVQTSLSCFNNNDVVVDYGARASRRALDCVKPWFQCFTAL